jgi:hypothetical protein
MATNLLRHTSALAVVGLALSGCGTGSQWTVPPDYAPMVTPAAVQPIVYGNPVFVPSAGDPLCFWETLVDVVDDYFPIEHEEPVRLIGNTPTKGSLTTVPQVSPTVFEPWRHDAGDHDQRVENTLQTMRRRAAVRVDPAPEGGGYWVEIVVAKELENCVKPEHATAGAATLRYDSTLTGIVNPVTGESIHENWIDKGRDVALEQKMIGHLMSRFGQVAQPTLY